jgi:hypothetical protein
MGRPYRADLPTRVNVTMPFHGIDRFYPGTSDLLPQGGRINLTLRRVTRPAT